MKRITPILLLFCLLAALAALLLLRPPSQPPPPEQPHAEAPRIPDEYTTPPAQTPDPTGKIPTDHPPEQPHQTETPEPPSVTQVPPPDTITLDPTPLATDDMQIYYDRFQPAGLIELVHITPLARTLQHHQDPSAIRQLRLPIPRNQMIPVEVQAHNTITPGRGVFTGKVEGHPRSEVIVSYFQDAITASIIVPGFGHYEIACAGGNNHLLIEMDPGKFLPEAPPRIPPSYQQDKENSP